MLKTAYISGLFLFAFSSYATTPLTTSVSNTGINSNGNIFITFADVVDEPGCPGKQVVLEHDNQYAKHLLSLAMTAHAANLKVVIKTHGCFAANTPGFLPATQEHGYFYLEHK